MTIRRHKTFGRLLEAAESDPKRAKYWLTHDKNGQPIAPSGKTVNAADFRDNMWDILEELRDSIVILNLFRKRLPKETIGYNVNLPAIEDMATVMEICIDNAVTAALTIRELLPPDMARDQHEVIETGRLYYEPSSVG